MSAFESIAEPQPRYSSDDPQAVPVPGLPGAAAQRTAYVPEQLSAGRSYSPIGEVAAGTVLLHAPGIGRFLVRNGSTIEYMVFAGADEMAVERFLWSQARSALIHQRGDLPLHAAAVSRPDASRAICICGASGAGKSSTAAELMRLGWGALADDQSRIEVGRESVCVWPGPRRLRLCLDACAKLAIDTAALRIDPEDASKVMIDLPAAHAPQRLEAVIELGGDEPSPRLEKLEGAQAMAVLTRHVVGPRKMRAIQTPERHVATVAAIARSVSLWRLHGRRTASARTLAAYLNSALQ